MRKALVSLAVGDRCFGPWSRYLHANWSAWCNRHGYDLIVFESLLDSSSLGVRRSPAWQKLLAMSSPSLQGYDRALWLDADVLICPDAEDPFQHEMPGLISMARDVGSPLAHEPLWFKNEWSRILSCSLQHNHHSSIPSSLFSDPEFFSYFALWGINQFSRPLFNTGFIAFSPHLHSSMFADIYHHWPDGGPGALYEMIPVNLELAQRRLIHEIPARFNQLAGVHHAVWSFKPYQVQAMHHMPEQYILTSNEFLLQLMHVSSFLHFAGAQKLMTDFLRYCQSEPLLRSSLHLNQLD